MQRPSKSKSSKTLAEALRTATELIGYTPSDDAADAMLAMLSLYPEEMARLAIVRASRECRGRLALADLLERLDDGRPGPEEAWGTVGSADERRSYVSTTEAMQALAEARMLLALGDGVAGRMAFLESYRRIVSVNRARGAAPEWTISLGTDPGQREAALRHAVERGRLEPARAAAVLGVPEEALAKALPAARRAEVLALPAPEPCGADYCDGRWHYSADPETERRPSTWACPKRPA